MSVIIVVVADHISICQRAGGFDVDERRNTKRTDMPSRIVIKRLDGGTGSDITVNITDVSKGGIGFECYEALKIGEVYEAYLTLWTREVLHAFLRIVRIRTGTRGYIYGAVFVGMSATDAARIEVYQTVHDNDSILS